MKALLYCTKSKPYLIDMSYPKDSKPLFMLSNERNPHDIGECGEDVSYPNPLNGTICFECEIEKAERVCASHWLHPNGLVDFATESLEPNDLGEKVLSYQRAIVRI